MSGRGIGQECERGTHHQQQHQHQQLQRVWGSMSHRAAACQLKRQQGVECVETQGQAYWKLMPPHKGHCTPTLTSIPAATPPSTAAAASLCISTQALVGHWCAAVRQSHLPTQQSGLVTAAAAAAQVPKAADSSRQEGMRWDVDAACADGWGGCDVGECNWQAGAFMAAAHEKCDVCETA